MIQGYAINVKRMKTLKKVNAKIISVNTLFAIILIAESELEEKEIMIALIMNFLQKENV